MSGLVLKLGPKERVLINGAVIENGDRRTRLNIVTPNANILRLRDAIHPDEVNSPVRRVCYIIQLVLSGDADKDEAKPQVLRGIEQLSQVFSDPECSEMLTTATDHLLQDQYYKALKSLKALMVKEEELMREAGS